MNTTADMKDCQDVAPLLSALAEEEAGTLDPAVARHLAECGSCQRSLRLQREMHGLLRGRAGSLQAYAPDTLRARLAAQAGTRQPAARRWRPLRMPVAATLALAMTGVLLYGLTSHSSRLLAAQLALDHLKCVQLVAGAAALEPAQAARDWAAQYQWTPRIPAPPAARKAALVGVRRCLYGHGHLAHLLYDIDGRVVSLFVMPRSEYPAGEAPATHEFLGQHAEVWGEGDTSFAVVGDIAPETLATLAAEFRAAE